MARTKVHHVPFDFTDKPEGMNDIQAWFCMEYIRNGFNAVEACITVGYSKRSAHTQASRLLSDDKVKKFLKVLKKDVGRCIGVDVYKIANEYKRIGFSDIGAFIGPNNELIRLKDVGKDNSAAVESIEVFELYEGQGEKRKKIGETKKLKLHNKISALEKLSRMLGVEGISKAETIHRFGKDAADDEDYV
jgi:phage terminase small subunit